MVCYATGRIYPSAFILATLVEHLDSFHSGIWFNTGVSFISFPCGYPVLPQSLIEKIVLSPVLCGSIFLISEVSVYTWALLWFLFSYIGLFLQQYHTTLISSACHQSWDPTEHVLPFILLQRCLPSSRVFIFPVYN